ncbi:MAG: hypothetical protein IKI29_01855 [Clostridia bacterium]|nr:hypothetical protein [Clostridia bacterium]
MTQEQREWAIGLLKEKASALSRLPKKDDFDDVTRSKIKSFLGPWPRALEAAGLKSAKAEQITRKKEHRK